jgi:hypothetical protein
VTFLTARQQNRRDVPVVGHLAIFLRFSLHNERAADRFGDRFADRFSGDDLVECVLQIVIADLQILLESRREAVVDTPAIPENGIGIEDEGLGRFLRLKCRDRRAAGIVIDRESELEFRRAATVAGVSSSPRRCRRTIHPCVAGHVGQHRRITRETDTEREETATTLLIAHPARNHSRHDPS